jgi:uncharacterized membrane protein
VKRDLGHRTPDTPQARKKQRVVGALVILAAGLNIVTQLNVRDISNPRLIVASYGVSAVLLLAALLYILLNRKAA